MGQKCVVEVQAAGSRVRRGRPFGRATQGLIGAGGRRTDGSPCRGADRSSVRKERHRERRACRRRGSVRPGPGRNGAVILDVLRDVLPRHGRILEVASGSGEHAVRTAGGHAPIRASGLAGSGCRE
ncbi:DUF938 domain-containing protein [Methylorubrum extorquens]